MRIIFHFIFLLLTIPLVAQLPRVMLRNYNTDHGLASSESYIVFQDHLGYQWIGTDNGVSCFNGYEFKNFGSLDGLDDPVVTHFGEDQNKTLWACTLSGRLYRKDGNKFVAHPLNSLIVEKSGYFVQSFMIDEDKFYIGIIGRGILVVEMNGVNWYSDKNENIQVIQRKSKIAYASITNDFTPNIISINYNIDNKNYVFKEKIPGILINSLSRACTYNEDSILICNGMNFFVLTPTNLHTFSFKNNINSIAALNNKVFISYNNSNGVKQYDNIQNLLLDKGNVIISNIRGGGVTQDRNKLLWFNTIDNGIYMMPNENIKIFDKSHFDNYEFITSIAPVDSVSSYVLLRNGSIFYVNISSNTIKNIYSTKNGLGLNNLFFEKNTNQLYYLIAGYLLVFDNKLWKTLPLSVGGYQLYCNDRSKNLFTISHVGFNIISLKNHQFIFESYKKLPSIRTLSVLECKNGNTYIGNVNGLYNFKNEKLNQIDLKTGSSPIRIEALEELKDGTLVIGTKGRGLLLKKNENLSSITSANKLTSDMIECVHVDEEDNIWVGTLNGLNKLKLHNGEWEVSNYSTATGLPSNEINTIKSSGNTIWIGTPKGMAIIDNKKYFSITKFTKPIIERIEINNDEISKDQDISFSFNRNNIQIQYITLAYQKFGNILYRYRFNENSNWTTTSDKRITYIAPEGKHRFEIQSQNENYTWSESTFWKFSINPPWWKSWIFLSSAFLVICLAAYSFYRLRISQLKKIAKTENEKIQLQNKALQAQMNPHFLFNCLNSIQSLMVQGESENAVDYLSKFAKLVRNVLNTSNKEKITLESDLILLNNYLELEKIRFGEKLSYTISIANDIDQYDVMVPPLLIQPFVENAIIHGISPLVDKVGQLIISYQRIKNKLDIVIVDNGIGIYQAQKKKSLQNDRVSYGIETSKQRIKLLEIEQENYFIVEELTDDFGNIIGTKINIQIPI